MLTSEFEHSGEFLFRWRSYIPLLLIAAGVAALADFQYPLGNHTYDTLWDFLCYGISLGGLALRIATVGFVRRDTSGRNTKGQVAKELNTSGIYSIMRHPLYFGNFWMWFGASLFTREWWFVAIACLAFTVVYERIIFAEERYLLETFGNTYLDWTNRTPAFWPHWRLWRNPDHSFSIRAVLRRENSTFLGVTTVFFFMEMVSTYLVEGELEIDTAWIAVFLFALVTYAVLKTLKKLKFLSTPGR